MNKHDIAKNLTKNISKTLHTKIELKKYELLPCKTVNNHIEISVYGNRERLAKVEKILTDDFNMTIKIDPVYKSLKEYSIENIHIIII